MSTEEYISLLASLIASRVQRFARIFASLSSTTTNLCRARQHSKSHHPEQHATYPLLSRRQNRDIRARENPQGNRSWQGGRGTSGIPEQQVPTRSKWSIARHDNPPSAQPRRGDPLPSPSTASRGWLSEDLRSFQSP